MAHNYPPSPIPASSVSSPNIGYSPKPPAADARFITRTPSPTPSEAELLNTKGLRGKIEWRKYLQWKYVRASVFNFCVGGSRTDVFLAYIIAGVIVISITILSLAFHDQIVEWLRPVGDKLKAYVEILIVLLCEC